MIKIKLLLIMILLKSSIGYTQSLNTYIQEGLSANEALKQQQFILAKSFEALKEAKGLFYPTLSFQSDYNYAQGGRKIDLPLGDLLNSAYSSLNQLTASNRFPHIDNQAITLAPNDYLDTRLFTTVQLVNAELQYNYKIKKEAITQQQAEVNVYKRGLIKSIKEGYYNLLLTLRKRAVFQNADILLCENLKLTQSLVANGKSLKSNLLRIQSDININQAKLTEAENNIVVAKAYFNFLLNKAPDQPVAADTALFDQVDVTTPLAGLIEVPNNREELQSLKSSIKQAEMVVKKEKAFYLPTLFTYANVGYQGTAFHFGVEQRYINGGISLKWNLFDGNQSNSRSRRALLDVEILKSQFNETENQLYVQAIAAAKAVSTAQAQVHSARANQGQAKEFYRETQKRYQQGLVLLVELTDASTQYINSQEAFQMAASNLMIKLADLEQATASYPL
jgi:outer membrane protein